MLADAADRYGTGLAIDDGDDQADLLPSSLDEARPFGAALVASGIEPGDRVAIWAFNSAEWVVAALGLSSGRGRAGAHQHPLQGRRGGRHPASAAGPGPWSP